MSPCTQAVTDAVKQGQGAGPRSHQQGKIGGTGSNSVLPFRRACVVSALRLRKGLKSLPRCRAASQKPMLPGRRCAEARRWAVSSAGAQHEPGTQVRWGSAGS